MSDAEHTPQKKSPRWGSMFASDGTEGFQGAGFKDMEKALETIKLLEGRDVVFQIQIIRSMYLRAKATLKRTNDPEKVRNLTEAIGIFESWIDDYKTHSRVKENLSYLPLDVVEAFEALAGNYGVDTKVPDAPSNFLSAYKSVDGNLKRLRISKVNPDDEKSITWDVLRNRHLKPLVENLKSKDLFRKEPGLEGLPTHDHTQIIMWAYSPEAARVKKIGHLIKKGDALSRQDALAEQLLPNLQSEQRKSIESNDAAITTLENSAAASWSTGASPIDHEATETAFQGAASKNKSLETNDAVNTTLENSGLAPSTIGVYPSGRETTETAFQGAKNKSLEFNDLESCGSASRSTGASQPGREATETVLQGVGSKSKIRELKDLGKSDSPSWSTGTYPFGRETTDNTLKVAGSKKKSHKNKDAANTTPEKAGTATFPFGYEPSETTFQGAGFKNQSKALETIKLLEGRDITFQYQVIQSMYLRAKSILKRTKDSEKIRNIRDAVEVYENWMSDYRAYSRARENFTYLPLEVVEGFEPLARRYSIDTRAPTSFVTAYKAVEGNPRRLRISKVDPNDENSITWDVQRNLYLDNLMEKTRNEPLYMTEKEFHELPTPNHTELIMWAYSPEVAKLKKLVQLVKDLVRT